MTASKMKGGVAVVTGGGSGIGRALAMELAKRGAFVHVTDFNGSSAEATAKAIGASAAHAAVDVRDAGAVQRFCDSVGRVDYMFNNAGIGVGGEIQDLSLAHWDRILDVNVRGVIHGVHAVYPGMIARGSGHIVNTASLAGLVPTPLATPYGMTKHAVVGLSVSLRMEAAAYGVRVSALCPGTVETPLPRFEGAGGHPAPEVAPRRARSAHEGSGHADSRREARARDARRRRRERGADRDPGARAGAVARVSARAVGDRFDEPADAGRGAQDQAEGDVGLPNAGFLQGRSSPSRSTARAKAPSGLSAQLNRNRGLTSSPAIVPLVSARGSMTAPKLSDRTSGLLLHPTSLPGPHGCGDLGAPSLAWLDFLRRSEQRWWQMLPIGPVGYGSSPYSAQSTFAGSELLVSLEPLVQAGWLARDALRGADELPRARVDYEETARFRERCLRSALAAFDARDDRWKAFTAFCEEARAWLDGFALYRAIKRAHGQVAWTEWPASLRDRDAGALAQAARDLAADVRYEQMVQWLFAEEWSRLRAESASRGIGLVGDVPIFVAHDSADVWQHRELFFLDAAGAPTVIAGVPPDYFSRTGQRWGNPLYRWSRIKQSGYRWWVDRMRAALARFAAVRLDHFIGFTRYGEIPAAEPTAVRGRWRKGPGIDLFQALARETGELPLIAEDLGVVTRRVKRLRDELRLPGIKVLQFAFGTDPQAPDFLPYNYRRRAVVYTGTHDNDTTAGWFHDPGGAGGTRSPEQTEKERQTAMTYLGARDGREIHWDMIRAVEASVASLAIVPVQDVLGLGSEARMNLPGTLAGNWEWRVPEGALTPDVAVRLADLARTYGRGAS